MKRPFFSTAFLSILGRSGGFLIPFAIAAVYGANPFTDAFFFAYALITFLTELFSQIFELILIPYLAEHKKDKGRISSLANGVFLLHFPLAAMGCLLIYGSLAPILTQWGGWSFHSLTLLTRLFLEITPMLFLNLGSSVIHGILLTHKVFWFPALSPLIRSLTVLIFLFFGADAFGIHALTIGFIIGEALRFLTSILLSVRLELWRFQLDWEKTRSEIFEFTKKAPLQILSVIAILLIPIVNQGFASALGAGGVSLLNYAERLLLVPYQLFIGGFLQVFLSDWSEGYYQEGSRIAFWPQVKKDIQRTFILALVVSIFLWLFHHPLTHFLLGSSEIQGKDLRLLSDVFGWLIIGFAPAVITLLYVRTLVMLKRISFYCLQSWVKLGLHALLNYFLMSRYGLRGIAISTSIVYIFIALWTHFYLKKLTRNEEGASGYAAAH